ncbi:Sn1-specific diacylglycerol lipase [Actinidia chinensis var. chinensis]|uniref:Sn1-specific diacylglycerol lipase n=1 Tax=Actinidia chinensis var. chinensis TaxID=1590841 RepID=A0A2R6QP54_ACTCC|nr:Sn1-specific diacylglycerol lipase [Actinidia chinensis var. chinensis]
MSAICGLPLLECVYCLACARWVWKKFLYAAGKESENWGFASAGEFEPVPRICRYILAVYEDDLRNPLWAPPGGYGMNPDWVILRRNDEETQGRVSPYMIYLDQDNADIVVAIRGLNMAKESDFLVLLDNKLGQTKFDGGYVHNGLLKAAEWVLGTECEIMRELIERNPSYTLTFAGHSLGAGVVTLLAMLVIQNQKKLGNIERKRIRCFAIAPARCISLNLAVRYADVINSIVLQLNYFSFLTRSKKSRGLDTILPATPFSLTKYDDFLPRTTMALEDAFKQVFCLPCLLCVLCLKDTCTLEDKMLKDPRRLYAPGRLYHIIVRKPFRIGKIPPIVKTAVPVDGRFEHLVLSCNMTSDHAIIWVERESQRALDLMMDKERIMEIPPQQRMERQASLARDHSEEYKAALQRAVALDVPQAYSPSSYGTFREIEEGSYSSSGSHKESPFVSPDRRKESWDDFVDRLFEINESGHMVLKKS